MAEKHSLLWLAARGDTSLTVDLLVEGAYTRLMVSLPETGGDIVSAVWGFVMVGALGASGLVAVVASGDAALFWWVATPFAAQVVLPVAAGWLGEVRSTGDFRGRELVGAHREVFGVSALIAMGALGLAAASLWGNAIVQAAVSISSSVAVCVVSLWLLPPVIGKSRCSRSEAAERRTSSGRIGDTDVRARGPSGTRGTERRAKAAVMWERRQRGGSEMLGGVGGGGLTTAQKSGKLCRH